MELASGPNNRDERQQNPESPPYRYVNIKGYDKDAFDILPITLKEGRLPEDEGEILLEYWVSDYMPSRPKIGDIITLPIGIRLDEAGNELSPNSYMKHEIFQEEDIRKYTIVGFFEPKFAWIGQYITTGITFLDSDSLSPDKDYNVYVKMDSVKDIHKKTKEIAQSLDLYQSLEDSSEPYYNIEYNERLLRLSAQSLDMDLNNSLISILIFIVILIIVSTIAVIYNAFHISVWSGYPSLVYSVCRSFSTHKEHSIKGGMDTEPYRYSYRSFLRCFCHASSHVFC